MIRKEIPHGLYITFTMFVFGLLQIAVLAFWGALSKSYEPDWNKIIETCGLLFFASGAVVSCGLAYFLNCTPVKNKKLEHFLFVSMPMVIVFFTIVSYLVALVDDSVKVRYLGYVQLAILVATFAYVTMYHAYEKSINK